MRKPSSHGAPCETVKTLKGKQMNQAIGKMAILTGGGSKLDTALLPPPVREGTWGLA